MDTHVHEIAKKHYGLSGSKAKANMTPQLYNLVNTKLTAVWGTYAGWAQTVSPCAAHYVVCPLTTAAGVVYI